MHSTGDLLKTDALGRVRTPGARREALLAEFARSGTSAKKFAELAGVNYQTFATWVQKQRREGGLTAGTVRLVEAVVEHDAAGAGVPVAQTSEVLWVHLTGGLRVQMSQESHGRLVAALVEALQARGLADPC
jgi:hypothetical protein